MRILTLIMAVTITLILPFGRASAQNSSIKGPRFATIGSATVNLVLPMNYCYLEESNQTDASLLKIMTSASASNRLLAAFASCKELAAWRAGTRTNLQNHGNFQTLLSAEHQNLSYGRAETAKAVCETLRKNKVDFRKIFSEGKNRTEKALPGAKILNQDVQGVLETTDNACYFGIYQHIRSQLGKEQQQIGVAATVLIKGKFFYSYIFAPDEGRATLDALPLQSKQLVAKLLQTNGG